MPSQLVVQRAGARLLWECNVMVCSFEVLGCYSMVCREGEATSIKSAHPVASLTAP